jgi:hypothetical protein
MESHEVNQAFSEMRANLYEAQKQVRMSLPLVAAHIETSTRDDLSYSTAEALSKLKRALRRWDSNQQKWK